MKSKYIFFICLIFFAIIAMTFQGSCTYGPYSLVRSSLNMSKYENFANPELSYSGYSLPNGVPRQNPSSVEDAYVKVGGFNGLYASPGTGDRKDIFYGTEGNYKNQSYGYMNSRGYLGLNDDQKKLLSTRGGNAFSGDSQIGNY